VIVPEALTAAQKLEMKGKAPTFDNIIHRVKSEAGKIESTLKTQNFSKSITDMLVEITPLLLKVVKVFSILVAISILCFLSVLLFSLFIGSTHLVGNISNIKISQIPNIFDSKWEFTTFKSLIALLFGIPLFLTLISLIKFIFNSKVNYKPVRRILGWLWLTIIPIIAYFVYSGFSNFKVQESIKSNREINALSKLKITADFKTENVSYQNYTIKIVPSKDSLVHLDYTVSASGKNKEIAKKNAKAALKVEENTDEEVTENNDAEPVVE
jgi:hypothetical protein